jgi:mRNA interferase MazF
MNTLQIFKTYDIVLVSFPFVECNNTKKRPALVISCYESFNKKSKHVILAMITSTNSHWPLDILINDYQTTGLNKSSIIRMKYFCLPNNLILKKIGILSKQDQGTFNRSFDRLFFDILQKKSAP